MMMPIRRRKPEQGQALTELAVFGSVALAALAFLIQIGLRQNYQQELEQNTFRRALQAARDEWNTDGSMDPESHSVQYYQFRNRELPDPGEVFAIMPRTLTQANATVLWGKWKTFLDAKDRTSEPKIIASIDETGKQPTKFRADYAYNEGWGNPNFFPPDVPGTTKVPKDYHVQREEYYSGDIRKDPTTNKPLPFVAGIRNTLISSGAIRQDNAGSSAQTTTRTLHRITFNVDPSRITAKHQPGIGSFLYSCNPLVLSNNSKHLKQQCD